MIKDDVTWIKGNHLIQFGGMYQRNYDYHMRTDNGQGINNADRLPEHVVQYQLRQLPSDVIPTGGADHTSQSHVQHQLLVRDGLCLAVAVGLHPLRPEPDSWARSATWPPTRASFPSYNLYVSDTWHMKPIVTLTYGLSYDLQMPPYELNGKQVSLVDTGRQADRGARTISRSARRPRWPDRSTSRFSASPPPITSRARKYPYDPSTAASRRACRWPGIRSSAADCWARCSARTRP